jgi:hypothetical protein
MQEIKTTWQSDLTTASMDRKGTLPTVEAPLAYDVAGVDADADGGLRPHPGFKHVYTFDPSVWATVLPTHHDSTSKILEFFPISFKIGSIYYAWGWVYRVRRVSNTAKTDIFIDYWVSGLGEWRTGKLLYADRALPVEEDPINGRQMSVAVWGRFVYVFVEGSEPFSFSVADNTPTFTETIQLNPGPGLRPKLLSVEKVVAAGLGGVTSIDNTDRPGSGQVFLTEYYPDEITDGGGLDLMTAATSGSLEEGYKQGRLEIVSLQPGSYSFAYVLYNSENGRRSALSEVAYAKYEHFDPDGGGAGVPVPLHAAMEITFDSTKFDQAYIYRSVRVEDAGGTYIAAIMHLDSIINLNEYLTSNNSNSGGLPVPPASASTIRQAVYFYELDDKQLVRQDTFVDQVMFDEEMPRGGCALLYEGTLLVSNIRSGMTSSSEVNRPDDALRGLGELRWSSLTDTSPELFSPGNRYYPDIPSNKIIAMEKVGPNVIGFGKDRQYLIRKEGGVSVYEIHVGYGTINTNTTEVVGTTCYFITAKGLKSVDVQAQLDDVKSLNYLVQTQWKGLLDSISMAHDPHLGCLFIHNEEREETVLLWFNTSKVTRLIDTPFTQVKRGTFPLDFPILDESDLLTSSGSTQAADWAGTLTERALFLQNHIDYSSSSDICTSFKPRLFVVDIARERTQTEGAFADESRRTLMDFTHDSIFPVKTAFSTGTNLKVKAGSGYTRIVDTSEKQLHGYKLYVLKSATASLVGKSATIVQSEQSTGNYDTIQLKTDEASQLYGLAIDDVVGISPMVVRWVGSPAPIQFEPGQPAPEQGFFRIRHFDSIGLSMTNVVNERAAEAPGFFASYAFRGSDEDPHATGYSLDTTGTKTNALTEYEGTYYAGFGTHGVDGSCLSPGIQIAYPDADFTLLGASVTGSVRGTVRTRMP